MSMLISLQAIILGGFIMVKTHAIEIFDGYATEYDQWFLANKQIFLSELKLLKSVLDLGSTKHVLSIGCGSGLFEDTLHRQYGLPLFDGVEPSTDMAQIAKKRGLNVRVGKAESINLPARQYDTIYFNGSSSYIKDLLAAYQNCIKALKSGGHFILIDVPKESAYGLMYMLAKIQGNYQSEELANVLPKWPYLIELVDSAYWHTTLEKKHLLENELQLRHLRFKQTLVANPLYTNDSAEEPEDGFSKGGYVAIIAEKP
ncbi:class I SAM-dependent DNA methyltransferase [Lentilactobacillus hilgardii]|uniref:Methyltransferase domain protein n=1 Tax=Lentilactobacillus hilgardii (strain ATCC 8290 / DSM 20176 / CCUG 30140 / JCM 1155 / KCTC 3500 / NBRC 15886 / NCIMB 8040 / NRRL B-1843 / 9) TaxID=1423757 RepID=C0XM30_LENH9|nr:methyltransferase domain protein [Lentilactobacillus hilgardii DSM 20176 = ATCC 8290]QEU38642.1 class I SAM-dependent methyltransferase [Lentilactobacillus hilgardii]